MCLAIPGQVVELVDGQRDAAMVDVAGVQRSVDVGLLADAAGGVHVGEWVLVHVGFALSRVDEQEAHAALSLLREMGEDFEAELAELAGSGGA